MSKGQLAALICIASTLCGIAVVMFEPPDRSPRLDRPAIDTPADAADTGPRIGELGRGRPRRIERLSGRQSLEVRLRMFARCGVLQKAAIVQTIRQRLDIFEVPLLEILDAEPAGIVIPAIEVAGRLDVEATALPLFSLLGSLDPRVRRAAVLALASRRRWETDTMRRLLEHETHPQVLTAALEVCALLDDPPLDRLLTLLTHPRWAVARAARDAIPSRLGAAGLAMLNEFIRRAPPGAAVIGAGALGNLAPSQDRDRALLEHIGSDVWSVRLACMQALIQDGGGLDDADNVWAVIEAPESHLRLKVHAFATLEKTRTFDDARTLRVVDSLAPVVRLAAARCLVVNRNPEGIRRLIDLLSLESTAVDDADVVDAAYDILKEVSERIYDPRPAPWLRWHRRNEPLPGRPLAVAPLLSW